ncbi:MAG: FHA domain-containing protein [Anaerolineales bacterium]|nr:FHA domain-containing protein [Anaerolineales bacterium]
METDDKVPMLIAQAGPAAGRHWPLRQEILTIGREPTCDIVIPDRQVSRVHAKLERDPEGFTLEDLGSKNGTHVNGAPVAGRIRLRDGDLIQVALVAKLAYVDSDATMPLAGGDELAARVAEAEAARGGRTLYVDSASRRVWVGEHEINPPLSLPQFRLIELLFENDGQVVSRDAIVARVWPEDADAGVTEQAVDALARRLRERIAELDDGHAYLLTVRGHGFRLQNR